MISGDKVQVEFNVEAPPKIMEEIYMEIIKDMKANIIGYDYHGADIRITSIGTDTYDRMGQFPKLVVQGSVLISASQLLELLKNKMVKK